MDVSSSASGDSLESSTATAATDAVFGQPPNFYFSRLKSFVNPNLNPVNNSVQPVKTSKKFTSTQVLHGLERSLRTASDRWLAQFLSTEANKRGLDALVSFLEFRLLSKFKQSNKPEMLPLDTMDEDVHLCLLCLKAIMLHPFGFDLVVKEVQHEKDGSELSSALANIVLSFAHPDVGLRAKTLALQLMSATCLVSPECHQLVLAPFNYLKYVLRSERRRFRSLVHVFITLGPSDSRLSVACMQFINIALNGGDASKLANRYRLQQEFSRLGLHEDYLRERLNSADGNELLQGHIQAYLSSLINGPQLHRQLEVEVEVARQANAKANFDLQEVERKRKSGRRDAALEKKARELRLQMLETQGVYITLLAKLGRLEQALEEDD